MAVDAEQRELLETYPEEVNFHLRTYMTDEVISGASGDVPSFYQSSSMTEGVNSTSFGTKRCAAEPYTPIGA